MSEQSSDKKNKDKDVILVASEDAKAALDFWQHFKVPLSEQLQKAVENFANDPTHKNQDLMKLEFCKAISSTPHEAFTDDMFTKIVEECGSVAYDMTFDKELEETLVIEEK